MTPEPLYPARKQSQLKQWVSLYQNQLSPYESVLNLMHELDLTLVVKTDQTLGLQLTGSQNVQLKSVQSLYKQWLLTVLAEVQIHGKCFELQINLQDNNKNVLGQSNMKDILITGQLEGEKEVFALKWHVFGGILSNDLKQSEAGQLINLTRFIRLKRIEIEPAKGLDLSKNPYQQQSLRIGYKSEVCDFIMFTDETLRAPLLQRVARISFLDKSFDPWADEQAREGIGVWVEKLKSRFDAMSPNVKKQWLESLKNLDQTALSTHQIAEALTGWFVLRLEMDKSGNKWLIDSYHSWGSKKQSEQKAVLNNLSKQWLLGEPSLVEQQTFEKLKSLAEQLQLETCIEGGLKAKKKTSRL